MKEKIPTELHISLFSWDVDTPALLKEVNDNTRNGVYTVCWNIFKRLLAMVATRAAELNDPVMNVLMLKLNLYGSPQDGKPMKTTERRKFIKIITNEIQYL